MVLEQSIGLFHIVQKCPLADFEALELWNVLSELEKSELQLLEVIFVNAWASLLGLLEFLMGNTKFQAEYVYPHLTCHI